jgi:hypothetical protein
MGNPTRVLFEYEGRTYSMTKKQIEAAYRYQKHQYLLMDALDQLDDYYEDYKAAFGGDEFRKQHGCSLQEAQSAAMLERYVAMYEKNHDCDMAESENWRASIQQTLREARGEQ